MNYRDILAAMAENTAKSNIERTLCGYLADPNRIRASAIRAIANDYNLTHDEAEEYAAGIEQEAEDAEWADHEANK